MILNYFKISWRNLTRNRGYSTINIGGLAVGMAVAVFIGLWTRDELSHDTSHDNYPRIAQVTIHQPVNGKIHTDMSLPLPVSSILRDEYGHLFEEITATWTTGQTVAYKDKLVTRLGCFTEAGLPEILTMKMVAGTKRTLVDKNAVMLSASLAEALFAKADPIGEMIKINFATLQVMGVYEDFPQNSSFSGIGFIGAVDLVVDNGLVNNNWLTSAFNTFVVLRPGVDLNEASAKISNILIRNDQTASRKAQLFLNPMRDWHLYAFEDGVRVGGRIKLIGMITTIGGFILALACINFVNLTTARSEKRMKEVGIRKSVGSLRIQLIFQFFNETLLIVILAFVVSLVIVTALFPMFNEIAGKALEFPWSNPTFWLTTVAFILTISAVAGCYPALYLSGFNPAKVLKGAYKAGRFSALPRKGLVVVQFTISAVLIVGTLIVQKQIEHVKSRSIGYERSGLLAIQPPFSMEAMPQFDAFRNELLAANVTTGVTRSSSPTTNITSWADNLDWPGKDPDALTLFGTILVDPYFDQVVKWKIKEGRNFEDGRITDSLAFIFNETAIERMGLDNPIGKQIRWHGKTWTIIGVVEDMVMTSPFTSAPPTVFLTNTRDRAYNVISMKIDEDTETTTALAKIESIFKKFAPNTPFVYRFADQEYASKFAGEERTGKLASILAVLAVIISCLGLIGLASYIAEQRTKEIGIRKVVGATVFQIWKMITAEFLILVLISCVIAVPFAYYVLTDWLQQYQYHTNVSWPVFAITLAGSMAIALLSVGYHAIDAAIANPVKSLRSE